jgi:superfamily II DNA or RNA helicase
MKPRYYPYKTSKPVTTTTKNQKPFLKGKGKEPIKKKEPEKKELEKNNILTEDFRSLVRENAYIGTNGYTIPKSVFESCSNSNSQELIFLRESLTLEPKKDGYCPTTAVAAVSFPVFRENASKIYLPQFYGIERYGMPKNKLSFGDDISVPFVKPIRDYQEAIIDVYLRHISHSKEQRERTGGGILEVPCGRGKTVMGLKIISILSKKTLILVHKEFLMNQWIERIAEFLPAARVGKIQGPVFDIVEKDIVIGMIQSLYDRTFPTDAFSSFGLTIIDEVHRIGSEEFSKTLFKTITRCMLGISATVERKDGLTCLLYHFIGPKIYSEERKDDTVVEVRAIEYIHPQEEYNVVAYDYKGNVQYSTMVSKISNFVPRSQFLVQIIRDLIRAQPDQQIMVLSHIRALLTFLHDHLACPSENERIDVGYYVGGMKKEALEATERKKVVLATYAMAAEALDIKTLNTLVMVSPKTDIIQSVGRILRMKADGKVIVDIVDTHDVFQNQWKKRRAYYKKCGYGIRYVKSANYVDMSEIETEKWKRVTKPSSSSSIEIREEGEEGEEEINKKVCFISPELMEKMEE